MAKLSLIFFISAPSSKCSEDECDLAPDLAAGLGAAWGHSQNVSKPQTLVCRGVLGPLDLPLFSMAPTKTRNHYRPSRGDFFHNLYIMISFQDPRKVHWELCPKLHCKQAALAAVAFVLAMINLAQITSHVFVEPQQDLYKYLINFW